MKFKDTKYGDLNGQIYKGNIDVYDLDITSLEGAPQTVKGYFICSGNLKLTSLEGAPEMVGGFFSCSYNPRLISLKGAPKSVGGNFNCNFNSKLTSLEGAPESIGKNFNCYNNSKLISLKGFPKNVDGDFNCSNNPKLTQSEVDKLVKCNIKGKIKVPKGLKAPTKEDFKLYKKLGDRKYWKLKDLKDSL